MRSARLWFPVVVVLGFLAACGGDDATPPTAPVETNTTATATATAEATTTPPTSTTMGEPAPSYDFSAVASIIEAFVERNDFNGAGLIVVHRDDGVLYHDHWGEFTEDRVSLIASSSKMIAAGVLLRLHDDGLLDIDAPVAEAVGWGAANPTITPAQLVSNSSGLVGLGPDPGYPPYLCQFSPNGTLQECGASIFTTPDDDRDIAAPDTEFRYGGGQWQVAGALAETVAGTSWNELIDEIYVGPCDLDVLAFSSPFMQQGSVGFAYPAGFGADPDALEPTDNPNIEGGAYTTTGDYGKLLLMHLRDGRCGDTQVLSPEAITRLHEDRIGRVYDGTAGPETGYGMGWWVDRTTGRISDGGAFGAMPWLDLEDGYGAYLVIEESSLQGGALANELFDVIDAAVTG